MKRIIILIAAVTLPLSFMFAQGKLIERSSRKKPVWLNQDTNKYGFIKVSESSFISVEQAKEMAFNKLKDLATNAIAQYLFKTTVGERDMELLKEKTANSLYIKNISENTAVQTYWEHRRVKKQSVYKYYILYEFNDFEKKKVALDLSSQDSKAKKILDELGNP